MWDKWQRDEQKTRTSNWSDLFMLEVAWDLPPLYFMEGAEKNQHVAQWATLLCSYQKLINCWGSRTRKQTFQLHDNMWKVYLQGYCRLQKGEHDIFNVLNSLWFSRIHITIFRFASLCSKSVLLYAEAASLCSSDYREWTWVLTCMLCSCLRRVNCDQAFTLAIWGRIHKIVI